MKVQPIRSCVAAIEPYSPPQLGEIAQRAGVRVQDLIRLDSNENPYGPSPRVGPALADFDGHGFYPDYGDLERAVARYAGVDQCQVALGNGADEVIDLVMRLVLDPGQPLIICPPAFGMYAFFAALGDHPVAMVPRSDDFSVDAAAIEALMLRQWNGNPPRLLFVTSPGNPDGQVLPLDTIRRLLQLRLVVAVDEAYVEFGGPSAVGLLNQHENLVILRTFSKWAGLAGLRLGYALAAPALTDGLNRIRAPYNVNTAAMVAGLATLADMEPVQTNLSNIVSERDRLTGDLASLSWVDPLPSQANFVLCRLRGRSGVDVADRLALQGILVRSYSKPRLQDCVRITVGRPWQNDRLIEALQGMCESEA